MKNEQPTNWMRVLLLTLLLSVGGVLGEVRGDTLTLRSGRVYTGTFVGYENGQFVFALPTGEVLRLRPAEVSRLVIDEVGRTRVEEQTSAPARWESFAPVDVRLEEQWIKTEIVLSRGDRVRIAASGTILLDGRTRSGPAGVPNRRDPEAPLPEENDGALLAIVGQDPNTIPILVGASREFETQTDGVLYLTVNHWETRNASGAFRATIEVARGLSESGSGTGQRREKIVTVQANQPWTDTGIDVVPSMQFEILAEGTIEIASRVTSGPSGNPGVGSTTSVFPIPDEAPGALIAKIRYRNGKDSNLVFIGARGTPATEVGEYGRLFLGINDDYFRDNRGTFTVRIRW
jgi:hypothetical protein